MNIVIDVSEFQSPAQLDYLLRSAQDTIVGVYIKATQDITYRNHLADTFAAICEQHNTPYGYYDFLTNAMAAEQENYFRSFIGSLAHSQPKLKPMLDCEGAYDKWGPGVQHWVQAFGHPAIVYAQLSNMPHYRGLGLPLWVAQYDTMGYYKPQDGEIEAYKQQGYTLWQFTSNYMGMNQDASVLLADDISALRAV